MDLGTGKSRTLLEIAKLRQGKWDQLFWFTPCALRANTEEQILIHTDIPKELICIWDQKTLNKGIPRDALVHIIGIESIGSSDRVTLKFAELCTTRSFVAVDEATYIKGNSAKRTQRIINISEKCRYRIVLTGTPLTQGVVDLYSQMKFLSPKILGYNSFWKFAANHLEFEERRLPSGRKIKTNRIVNSHNEEYLAAKIAPYVYQVRKEECLSLPNKLFESFYFSMTDDQRNWYEKIKQEFFDETLNDPDSWSSVAIFRLFSRLQAVICGYIRHNGKTIDIDNDRLELLQEVLFRINASHIIVWAKYHYCVDKICDMLTEEYGEGMVFPYCGSISDKKRQENLENWRNNGKFLVCTQSLASHGLTLTESSHAIFYADGFKYSERLQSEDRIHRIGQTVSPTYITLVCRNSIDTRIQRALANKSNVLSDFQNNVQKYRNEGLKEKILDLVRGL